MDRIIENAMIVAELARLFPDEPAKSIVKSLEMPTIDANNAIWYGMSRGLLDDRTDNKDEPLISLMPEQFQHEELDITKSAITYCLGQLANKDQDISEDLLTQWLHGYKAHFTVIALKQLLEDGQIATYTLVSEELRKKKNIVTQAYVFYTLPENLKEHWGLKQFKNPGLVKVQE